MSSLGQQIDPLQALASQPSAPVDPLVQLASGQQIPAPSPQAPQQSNGDLVNPTGAFSAAVRNATNAATFNLADPAAAALAATFPKSWSNLGGGIGLRTSDQPTYGARFNDLLQQMRGMTAEGQKSYPITSLASSVVGGALNPISQVLPVPTSLAGAIGQGAGLGGAYGAGGSIGTAQNSGDIAKQTILGAGAGGLAGSAAYGLGKILSGATMTPAAKLLSDEGVPLTTGESLGGAPQTVEDATTHIPLLGNAIKARQFDAMSGFNQAAYNRALEPLGIEYSGPTGNKGISNVAEMIGNAYDKAYEGASVLKSPELLNSIDTATDEASNLLPQPKVDQIQANINRLVTGKFDENGLLNSDDLQTAKNFFAEQSRTSPTASLEDRATASAYGNVLGALKQGLAQTDPDRGAMLNAADQAYAKFLPIQQAAATNNAGKRAGIFTADQLGNALRSMDQSAHRAAFARGTMGMQDLVQAGQQVLPTTVPDSGSAVRGLVEAAPWLLAGHALAPGTALAAAGGLGAGTAMYSPWGQKLANALLFGAPASRSVIGQIPQLMAPGAIAAASQIGSAQP